MALSRGLTSLVVAVPYNACSNAKCNEVSAYTVLPYLTNAKSLCKKNMTCPISDFCIDQPGERDRSGFSPVKNPQLR